MFRALAASAALIALVGCAAPGAGETSPAAPPPTMTAPPAAASAAVPPAASSQPEAASGQAPAADNGDIVVPGQVGAQALPPRGDPRSNEERRTDVRNWDQCVMQAQGAFDADPMRPQLTSPEEYCATSLGMAGRDAMPISRSERRR